MTTPAVSFYQRLAQGQRARNSWLCIGLDPTHTDDRAELRQFLTDIIAATAEFASAYKPNLGFFLSRGSMGLDLLSLILSHVPADVPVILDAKFGDIGSTAAQYARFAFDQVGAAAVTLSPYVGTDGIKPFLAYVDRGVFTLCRTSNTDGNEFQPVGDPPLYEVVARQNGHLAEAYPGQVGLIVGATQIPELARIRALAPGLPFLVPGIGAQGGDLAAAVLHGPTRSPTTGGPDLGPLINVGRAILYASMGPDHAAAAAQAARAYRDEINALRQLGQAATGG